MDVLVRTVIVVDEVMGFWAKEAVEPTRCPLERRELYETSSGRPMSIAPRVRVRAATRDV